MGDSGEALRTCTCESLMKLIKEDVEYSDVSLTKAIPILLDSKTKNLVAFPVKAFADDKYYYLVLDGKTVYQSYLNNKTPKTQICSDLKSFPEAINAMIAAFQQDHLKLRKVIKDFPTMLKFFYQLQLMSWLDKRFERKNKQKIS